MIAVGGACAERREAAASFADAPARSSLQRDAAFWTSKKELKNFR
jgi:hypothetical protein